MKKLITIATIIASLTIPNCINTTLFKSNFQTLTQKVYAYDEDEQSVFSEEQINKKYKEFYENYHRRKDRIVKKGSKYIANYANKEIEVPKKFIDAFLSHLEQAKESGYCDYFFYADLNHCHAGLPKEHFEKEYKGLSMAEIREKSLTDPKLTHLYHSREHMDPEISKQKNRNILGYFNGRKIRLIHPKKANRYNTVFDYDKEEMKEHDNYHSVQGLCIYFRANKDGLFQLKDGTKLDIAL